MLQEDPDYDCGVRSSAVFGGLLTLSLFAGCHDLGLPPEPGSRPGSVTVTALVPREGQAELVPASGAVLELVGSGLRAEADADGNVRLEGIRQGTGQLSLTATSPGSTDTFARVFDVALSGVGPGHDVSLGIVALGRRARLVGTVRRADVDGNSGHSGIQVFIPRSPLITTTADDGYFVLSGVPEGRQTLTAFAPGYAPVSSSLDVRAAEERRLEPLVVPVQTQVSTGALQGRAVDGAGNAVDGLSVTLANGGPLRSATVDGARFSFDAVPSGVLSLRLAAPSFITAHLDNVFFTGTDTELGTISLRPGQDAAVEDAGVVADAGPPFAGLPVMVVSVTGGLLPAGAPGSLQIPISAGTRAGDLVLLTLSRAKSPVEPLAPLTTGRLGEWSFLGSGQSAWMGTQYFTELAMRRAQADEVSQAASYTFTRLPMVDDAGMPSLGEAAWAVVVLRHAGPPELLAARVASDRMTFGSQRCERGELLAFFGFKPATMTCDEPVRLDGGTMPDSTWSSHSGTYVTLFEAPTALTLPPFYRYCALGSLAAIFELRVPQE